MKVNFNKEIHKNDIYRLIYLEDKNLVITGSRDNSISFFDIRQ